MNDRPYSLAALARYFLKLGSIGFGGPVAFVDGVTAAAIGAITGAGIVIAQRSIIDVATAVMALVTVGLLWKAKKVPEPVVVAFAGVV